LCAVFFDEGAVAHTFSVASGLDSLVVGESQILGQVKAALTLSQAHETVGTVLNSLFQQAIRVGKRVHTETGIGAAGRSLISAAYRLLTDELGALDGQRVLVVGAGAMAGLAARTAATDGAMVTCANRTLARAERLAEAVGGKAVPLADLSQALAETDVLVTCTGARTFTIGVDDLAGTPVRGIVDVALPADVAPEVTAHGVCLVNLDRLVTDQPDSASAQEIEDARDLVRDEVASFLGLRRAAQVAPTVVALRSMASAVVAGELRRLEARLPQLDDHEREQIQRSMRRIVDKLLHTPTVRVQELSAEPDAVDYAAALRVLFALDPQAVAAVMTPEVGL
jgi:glutamyl-tRNA reductase